MRTSGTKPTGSAGRNVKKFERLDEAKMPNGAILTLCRHDGAYLVRSDGAELMSTRHHYSEDRLAEVVCEPIRDKPEARVLIGGLGLGFTLRAALGIIGSDTIVDVVELSEAVIRWNRNPEYELALDAVNDRRTIIIHDDAVRVLAATRDTYDGIMLDVDNGVEPLTTTTNDLLYTPLGVRNAVAALKPGGRLAYWSAVAHPKFERTLRGTQLPMEVISARAHHSGGAEHRIYVLTRRDS